jgi:hypothetical protein
VHVKLASGGGGMEETKKAPPGSRGQHGMAQQAARRKRPTKGTVTP